MEKLIVQQLALGPNVGSIRSFTCGELGHQKCDSKKAGYGVILASEDDEDVEIHGQPVYNKADLDEEFVKGIMGTSLVIHRSFLTSKVSRDNWLMNNIFQSMCTILGKVCRFVIDA